jgi:UDP-N-acetylglucosamine 2-epimerase (non-hydrolysing)
VDRAIRAAGHEHVIVHTGQHYAPELSANLFDDLSIPTPDVNLEVGSGTHATQTGRMMLGLEPLFIEEEPDWVLVYGDTNSTAAAALSAVKIHQPIAHLEAGLRSGNRRMPEEHNRVVTDHLADLLLAPTETAMDHLRREGVGERAVNVGDVMTDVCFTVRDAVSRTPPSMPTAWRDDPQTLISTIHRAENTDTRDRLAAVLDGIERTGLPVLLVAHPRLLAKANEFGLSLERTTISPIPSMTYSQMVFAIGRSRGVITDSGGLQKEAFLLGTPCITVRTETEWPETLIDGWNLLDPSLEALGSWSFNRPLTPQAHPFGDGNAAQLVVEALERRGS